MIWSDTQREICAKGIAVLCELTGAQFSDPAKTAILNALSAYQFDQVAGALRRCAHECKGRLTLADILTRLDDGRPGAEEAWASFPKREEDAGLVTDEMSVAWGVAAQTYLEDEIGARMAFKEAYLREVTAARTAHRPVKWNVSPGFDKTSTIGVVREGLARGLITERQAQHYLPPEPAETRSLPERAGHAIPENIRPLIAQIGTGRIPRPDTSRTPQADKPTNPPHWQDEP